LTAVLLLLLAFLLYKLGLTEKIVSIAIIAIYVITTFFAGFITGEKMQNRKFIWGLLMGTAYFFVLVVVSYVLASGDPVAVNLATEPTAGELKMTDTLLILTYLLMAGSFIALIWGGAKKLIQNR
jgi:putative membrane protein (TIGR04086 family)